MWTRFSEAKVDGSPERHDEIVRMEVENEEAEEDEEGHQVEDLHVMGGGRSGDLLRPDLLLFSSAAADRR
ncbi:hypothetical protein QJS10_CPB17g00804 [Acorus calamus]|uniref:Uncharacterized protein n=1 Tax=Acorus calamus TaxID=4465 RepID=A0AAV9CX46_ACOCL|nr:hypothetical protein QJS10_CPB17g00804 [Acorus calamus]